MCGVTIRQFLIRQQYDQMVKYATTLRLGIAETETILRHFTRSNLQHPTYKASRRTRQSDEDHFSLSIFEFAGVAARN